MKIKKFIGQKVNGFWIVDTYPTITANGKKTRNVLLRCDDCGREFERRSGVDFDHIKCKCKCVTQPAQRPRYHYVTYKEQIYTLTDICKVINISPSTYGARLKAGATDEEIIEGKYKRICRLCEKPFETDKFHQRYCSKTCKARKGHGKGKKKVPQTFSCVVCGKTFESIREDAKTCSKECRWSLAKVARNRRYKKLIAEGRFDESVTLENVFKKFNGKCQICGLDLSFESNVVSDEYPSIDHIHPLSKGGSHSWDNVQLLCRKCNYTKKDKEVETA